MGLDPGPREYRTFRVTMLALYFGMLLVATLGPVNGIPKSLVDADKLVHMGLFGGLVPLLYVNLPPSRVRRLALSVMLAVALAGMVELVQIPLPHRSGDYRDLVAGSAGAVLAGTLTPWLVSRLSRRWATRESVT